MAVLELWKGDCVIAHPPLPKCIHDGVIIRKTNTGVGYIYKLFMYSWRRKGALEAPKVAN